MRTENSAVKAFGELVRVRRKALGWSQEALAAEAFSNSTRKNYISQIENGKVPNITRNTVKRVAQAVKIDLEEIPPILRWPEAIEVVKDTHTVTHEIQIQVNKLVALEQERARQFGVKEDMLIALASRYGGDNPNDFKGAHKKLDRVLQLLESKEETPVEPEEEIVLDSIPKKFDVMIINTGGAIGSLPEDPKDPTMRQNLLNWDSFIKRTPELREQNLGYRLGYKTLAEPYEVNSIGPDKWIEIVKIIEANYDDCEGFVILHETDTMSYTASALSFMLGNLSKPVVLTGAQPSHVFQVRNDRLLNLITALTIANPNASNIPVIPEVMIAFGSKILRGNRATKVSSNGFVGYHTPKYAPLAVAGHRINIDRSRILPMPKRPFFVRKNLEASVLDFEAFPGIADNNFLERLLNSEGLKPKGIVIRSYGSGNGPTDRSFMQPIINWIKDHNATVLNVTQCTLGAVDLGFYESSRLQLANGVVSGADLMPETALVKLMIALADKELLSDRTRLRNYLQTNQVGEQSTSIYEIPFQPVTRKLCPESPYATLKTDRLLPEAWTPTQNENIHIRLYGVKFVATDKQPRASSEVNSVEIEIFTKTSRPETSGENVSSKLSGHFQRTVNNDEAVLIFDLVDETSQFLIPEQSASFGLKLLSEMGELEWERADLALCFWH